MALGNSSDIVFGAGTSAAERNKVLRNTYMLLAVSLVPTVLGAWLGMALNINKMLAGSPFMVAIGFMAVAFGFFWAIEKNKNSGLGVVLLLAFTFFMGLMLSRLLGSVMTLKNGSNLIMTAFGGTAIIFAAMATLGTSIKKDLSSMGKWLFVGAIIVLLAGLANIFLKIPALHLALSVMCIAIFSAFMLYDVNRIVTGGETNYVSATLSLYLNIYNVFSSLLSILGITSGDRD